MKYFASCHTLDELKKEYRRLAMKHHPDHGGDLETMKAVNAQYEEAFETLKHRHNATHDEDHQTTEAPEEFIRIIEALLNIPGIIVELCGSWLWISGDTKPSKEELKACGCRWSSSKKMWYWRHQEDGAKWSRGKKSMNQIRNKYGSQTFTASGSESSGYTQIAAAG